MKILNINVLAISDIKVIKYARYLDHRGYFNEIFRKSDINSLDFLKSYSFPQSNESYSKKNTIRGLHFQWNPRMGKLVRTISGHMIDLVMDIRKGSPTLGKIIAYDMPAKTDNTYGEWIWVPPGFAHGNYFLKDSIIEYFCTSEYNPSAEGGISPLAEDLDWSLCKKTLLNRFNKIKADSPLITDKDKSAQNLNAWLNDPKSDNFTYQSI